jgi:N-acetylglutamate synthase-like GNAT family acetyltransferase/2-polyprenyl-3-methyl-5-hydroxy-6-metoxy-1,4-benzoquinol methylase
MSEQLTQGKKLRVSLSGGGCCGGSNLAEVEAPNAEEKIKAQVRAYYSERVQNPAAGGCCTKSADQIPSIPDLAGYQREVLTSIPAAAAEKSFGCGDPLAFAEVQPGQTVLDIGSGAGIDCFIASQKVGPAGKVIGLDMTPAMLETARRNARAGGYTNVEFRQGEAESMPVEDGSADWVISNCVINLSPVKEKVFAEINRVLKPGGRVSISDIVAEALPDFVRQDQLAYCGCIGGAIPEADYLSLLAQAGLADVHVEARLDYAPEQIRAMILADAQLQKMYGAIVDANPQLLEQIKIASIKVAGRKPATGETVAARVESATAEDLPAVEQLLHQSNLPIAGLHEIMNSTLVARQNGNLVGVIGLERYGDAGLMRSFAVAKGWRGRGVGKNLGNALLQRAAADGLKKVYLLTNTIRELAAGHGFREIPREQVPAAVRESVEFRLNCCDTAVAMERRLV